MSKPLTPNEAMQRLSKTLREELARYKSSKKELSPREAGLKVTDAIRDQIKVYQDKLVKMRQVEMGELLSKSGMPFGDGIKSGSGTPAGPVLKNVQGLGGAPQSDSEVKSAFGLQKNVFDILRGGKPKSDVIGARVGAGKMGTQFGLSPYTARQALDADVEYKNSIPRSDMNIPYNARPPLSYEEERKANPVAQRSLGSHFKNEFKLEKESDSDKNVDSKRDGAVLPSDKPEQQQDTKNTGSGSQIKKGKKLKKSETIFDVLKKNELVKDDQSKPLVGIPKVTSVVPGLAEQAKRKAIFDSVRHLKPLTGTPTVNVRTPKNPATATTIPSAPKTSVTANIKNAQMPTKQQFKPKLPFGGTMQPKIQFGKSQMIAKMQELDSKLKKQGSSTNVPSAPLDI